MESDSTAGPRIAMIHALEESIVPARSAFQALWPEAEVFDLLDTSLAVDLAYAGKLERSMLERFNTLAEYARNSGGKGGETAAILFTCSAFGAAIDAVKARLEIPVLRPNESAFEFAISQGARIGLIVTFAPSLDALTAELGSMAQQAGKQIIVEAVVAEGALAALKAGDTALHDRLSLQAARSLHGVDIIVLGQFSLARAASLVEKSVDVPVLTTPGAAVAALKARCNK